MNNNEINDFTLNKIQEILDWSVERFSVHNLIVEVYLTAKRSYVRGLINNFKMYLDLDQFNKEGVIHTYQEYASFSLDEYIGTFVRNLATVCNGYDMSRNSTYYRHYQTH